MPWLVAAIWSFAIAGGGIPELRHDWSWPLSRLGFVDAFIQSWSAWDATGIGAPTGPPEPYLLAALTCFFGLIFGPWLGLLLTIFGIASVVTVGVGSLAGRFGANATLRTTLVTFALVNPWVYTKVVSGHLFMVLAYGAIAMLVSELLVARYQTSRVLAALVLISPTIQFFLPMTLVLFAIAIRTRDYKLMAIPIGLYLPVFVVIAARYGDLRATPYLLQWQISQSIPAPAVFALSGYFTKYDIGFAGLPFVAALAVNVLVLVTIFVRRDRFSIAIALSLIAIFTIAQGTQGLLGAIYQALVLHLPESGIYRELYDILGIAVLLQISALSRVNIIRFPLVACVAAIAIGWFVRPCWTWWVDSSAIPRGSVDLRSGSFSRFALFPAFQPLSLTNYLGSGLDPDARLNGSASPINTFLPRWPEDSALSLYELHGDPSGLQELSVTNIVDRPWFRSNGDVFSEGKEHVSRPSRVLRPVSYARVIEDPQVTTVLASVGSGTIFITDVPGAKTIVIKPNASNDDPTHAWVDARLRFAREPEAGQPFGGVYTTGSQPLALESHYPILVRVDGVVTDGAGRLLATTTRRYIWVKAPLDLKLRCFGRCFVATQASYPHGVGRVQLTSSITHPISLRYRCPGLIVVDVPNVKPGAVLEFSERANSSWVALANGEFLRPIRIDGVFAGWYLNGKAASIVAFDTVSAVVLVAEILGTLLALTCVWYGWGLKLFEWLNSCRRSA